MTYNIGKSELVPFVTMAAMTVVLPMFFIPTIVGKIGKKRSIIVGSSISALGYGLVVVAGNSIPLLMIGTAIAMMGSSLGAGLMFVLIADYVDYGAFTETDVHEFTRRWLTYIPKSYDGSKEYPLIVALHEGGPL